MFGRNDNCGSDNTSAVFRVNIAPASLLVGVFPSSFRTSTLWDLQAVSVGYHADS